MSIQRAQGMLLFLVRFNNSARFEIYRVTRSSSSHPFLCTLARAHDDVIFIVKALREEEERVTSYSGRGEGRISRVYYK